MDKQVEIYKVLKGEVVFDVDSEKNTLWATQEQISRLFNTERSVITKHLRNIFRDGELVEGEVCAKKAHTGTDNKIYQVKMYNLDAIISVGYRVNSRKATDFRIWATKVLKQYVVDGIAVNRRRLEQLSAKKLENVEHMMGVVRRLISRQELDAGEANGVLEVISKYAGAFKTLEEYDDGFIDLSSVNGKSSKKQKVLTSEMCDGVIESLRKSVNFLPNLQPFEKKCVILSANYE